MPVNEISIHKIMGGRCKFDRRGRTKMRNLIIYLMLLTSYSYGQTTNKILETQVGSSGLIVIQDPSRIKGKLDSIISLIGLRALGDGWQGAGQTPQSVYEAVEFVQNSTHMRDRIFQCIEYRGYYIMSDDRPKTCQEWLLPYDPRDTSALDIFNHGFVVKKTEKMIRYFRLTSEIRN